MSTPNLDKVRLLEERILLLEREIAGLAEWEDSRLSWVTIQVDREIWMECLRKHAPEIAALYEKGAHSNVPLP
jgi:hypothetical protein